MFTIPVFTFEASFMVSVIIFFCYQVIYVNRFSPSSRKHAVSEIKVGSFYKFCSRSDFVKELGGFDFSAYTALRNEISSFSPTAFTLEMS